MAEPIPTEAVRDVTGIVGIAVSPDGDRVAAVVTEYDATVDESYSSIVVAPTDGGDGSHRLTRLADASSPRWSPDGRRLAFLGAREDDIERRVGYDPEADEGDEEDDDEPETQVWAFDLDRGGDARQLTDREHGVREFDWAPDGERLVIAARDPTDEQDEYLERREDDGPIEVERLQHKADGVGYTDDVLTYLFVHALDGGEPERLDDAYGDGAFEPFRGTMPRWHPEEDRIAFIATRGDRPTTRWPRTSSRSTSAPAMSGG